MLIFGIGIGIVIIVAFLYWLIAPRKPQLHDWSVGRDPRYSLYYVYADNKQLNGYCATKSSVKLAARWYALQERHSWTTPVDWQNGRLELVKRKTSDKQYISKIAELEAENDRLEAELKVGFHA